MPAVHDFALFVYYALDVAKIAANVLAAEERHNCSSVIEKILRKVAYGFGRGKLPGHIVWDSTRIVIRQLEPDEAALVNTAQTKFCAALGTPFTDGYGVLRVWSSGLLIKAFVCACIDDVLDEAMWRNAFRYAATVNLDSAHDVQESLRVMLIARAFEEGALLKSLLQINFDLDADIITMFGKYVSSNSVSAHDILYDFLSSTTGTASLQQVAMQSVMWNLVALDHNGTAPSVEMLNRLMHNMTQAGAALEKLLFNSSSQNILEKSETAFLAEMRAAKADVSRFVRKHGSTYFTKLYGRQTVAWVYIIGALTVAISCAAFNWTERDIVFDRAKDAFEISTFLLVSVFGLVKLASEDPNALKNLATGKSIVEDLANTRKFLSSSSESLQKLLSVDPNEADWASGDGCTYGRAVYGDGLDTGPAEVATLKQCGFFLLEGICKRPYFWDTCDTIENGSKEVARILPMSELVGELQFSNAPLFSRLS